MKWLLFLAFAYLLGSVPTGLVVARLLGANDPRRSGSGNIGATNVGRTLGRGAGAATLAGDALKGFLPVAWAYGVFASPWAVAAVGLAAFLGHLFPVYLGFKGGKGVATGLGVFLALAPGALFWAAVLFAAVVWGSRMVSLGSMSAAAALPLLCAFFQEPLAVVTLALAVGGLLLWKHQPNVERILAGTENRVGGRR
ncbi:MAG: glycerol-3-phosphate 1-O-acyltransferase PlsY [Deferrisomatales bacterium]|nr:glycerol-3-phosphate 1-O-acyltransferase PlsY [Deferrisomatales bacterium]